MTATTRLVASVVVATVLGVLPAAAVPPGNDECTGAVTIFNGPYPVTTPPIEAADATPQGTDDAGLSAACNSQGIDYTIWYTFTPSVSTTYTFTTCPAQGATGETVLDTVIALFSSSDGTCSGTLTSLACNDSAACSSPGDLSTMTVSLTAGTTYYIVVGHWVPDGALTTGHTAYVLNVRLNTVNNDICSGAIALELNRIFRGSTVNATGNYSSPATAACFSGPPGTQNPTSSPGKDVVFTFTAPAAGNYSIRYVSVNPDGDLGSSDPVLYTSSTCPSGDGVVSCLQGANHLNFNATSGLVTSTGHNNNRGEEITCMPLAANQQIYIFLDDGVATSTGGQYGMEVTPCVREIEPNDTLATATPYSLAYCGSNEGSISTAPAYHCVAGVSAGQACQVTNPVGGVPSAPVNCNPSGPASVGRCFPDSVCEDGPNAGQACVPRCVGGPTPGLACGNTNQCGAGGTCADNGQCGVCTAGTDTGQSCVADTTCGTGGVCSTGTCGRTANEGDVDYWSLGTPVSGSKVYAAIAGAALNDDDLRMRITSATSTLQFDEDDDIQFNGAFSPAIAGAKTDGTATYVRVSKTSPFVADPYRLYTAIQPPAAQAQAENGEAFDGNYGWPGDGLFDDPIQNPAGPNGYVKGAISYASGAPLYGDTDCYKMWAHKGDDLIWFGDSNPDRVVFDPNQGPTIPQAIIYDADGAGISNFVFNVDTTLRNIGPAFTPGQTGLLPRVNSFFQHWRATYTGAFELCFFSFLSGSLVAPGPFPTPYTMSLTNNCGPMAAAGPGATTTDLAVTETGPAGPVSSSDQFSYTITITNTGSDIALDVNLDDMLPPNLRYFGATLDDGFGGNNTACLSVPDFGASGELNCTTMSLEAGASVVYALQIAVQDCIDGGLTIDNPVSITASSTDPNAANDAATWSFTTEHSDACTLLYCSQNECVVDHCFAAGVCVAGTCTAAARDCDDNNVCTDDFCNPNFGCVNDPTPGNGCYGDGNPCTNDRCDPQLGCVFEPAPSGTPCNDFLPCTTNDMCDGNGNCGPANPCDDGNPCTDDSYEFPQSCTCQHLWSPDGTACEDGIGCTAGSVCSSGVCGGGQTITPPGEILDVRPDGPNAFRWTPFAYDTRYQWVRGLLSELPVGPGDGTGGSESCFNTQIYILDDAAVPDSGTGFWYEVRAINSCGTGTYGQQSDGAPRTTTTCP